MKLRKDKWEKAKLLNVTRTIHNITETEKTKTFTYIEIGSINDNKISEYKKLDWKNASQNAKQKVYKDDILISTVRVNLRKIGFIDRELNDGIATVGFCVIRANEKKAISKFLFYVCLSDSFTKKLLLVSSGTTYPIVKNKNIFDIAIPLPPLEEQKQIASLFQSIEAAIEQVENQEGNLKALQTKLCNGLTDNPPVFGKLLSVKNCALCKFGDVADCIEQHDKNPLENGITRFIGLENIEPENFNLQGFGNIENGTTFTKRFEKGDVLFGKRRAYLKKAAIADFDGICSSDILILRAKKEKILPELLPYYASSEAFIHHAVSTSAGSLSPRTKWRDLSGFELSIPAIKTQKKIVEVFKQMRISVSKLKAQKQALKNLKQKLLNEILE